MTTLVANTFNWIGFVSIANWLNQLSASMKHRKNVRETINELSKLTDYELNDIGMSRGDIYWVATSTANKDDKISQENQNLRGWV